MIYSQIWFIVCVPRRKDDVGLELVALAAIYGDDVDRHAEYISVATNIVVIFMCKTLSAKNRNGSRKLTKGAYVVLYPASVERSIEEL